MLHTVKVAVASLVHQVIPGVHKFATYNTFIHIQNAACENNLYHHAFDCDGYQFDSGYSNYKIKILFHSG